MLIDTQRRGRGTGSLRAAPIAQAKCCELAVTQRKPVVFRRLEMGVCGTELWKDDRYYLRKCGEQEVTVHVSSDPVLRFKPPNFRYMPMKMHDLIKRVFISDYLRRCGTREAAENEYLVSEDEVYYLRSVTTKDRRKTPALIQDDFPELWDDIVLPPCIPSDRLHSTVLRVSSQGVRMWLHYDTMDNILMQVHGVKGVTLFDPAQIEYLYMDGDKSQIPSLCPQHVDFNAFPLVEKATAYNCMLYPGDAIYIPVRCRNNLCRLYDNKDLYGNKDPVPATVAAQQMQRCSKELDKLPPDYKQFYLKKFVMELQKQFTNTTTT